MSSKIKEHDHIFKNEDLLSSKELKFRKKLYPVVSVIEERRVQCTVCLKDIKHIVLYKRKVYIHKHLKVLLCKECHSFYEDGYFSVDDDGLDKYCRWCAQGGQLYMCSDCPCAFCKKCVKQNLARSALADLEEDDWKCYMCNNKPLRELRALCWAVELHINNLKDKAAKKSEKNKAPIRNNSKHSKQHFPIVQSNHPECKHTQKARNWFCNCGEEINSFCSVLKKRTTSTIERAKQLQSQTDVENISLDILRIIDESVQTLNDFKHSINKYRTKWPKQIVEPVTVPEEIVCTPIIKPEIQFCHSPEVIDLEDGKTCSGNESVCEITDVVRNNVPDEQHKNINSKTKNHKIDERPLEENNKEVPFVPKIRIKNVDELNGIVKTENLDAKTEESKTNNHNDDNNDSVSIILESDEDTNVNNSTNKEEEAKTISNNKSENSDSLLKKNQVNCNSDKISKTSTSDTSVMEIKNSVVENSNDNNSKSVENNNGTMKSSSDSSTETLFSSDSSVNVSTKKKSPIKKKRNDSDSSLSYKQKKKLRNKKSVVNLIDSSESSSNDKKKNLKNKKSIVNLIDTSEGTSDSSIKLISKRQGSLSKKRTKSKNTDSEHDNDEKMEEDENEKEKTEINYFSSSSEDDFRKLLDLKSLEKRKRKKTSSSSGSESSNTATKKVSKKKPKTVEKELSLIDCYRKDESDDGERHEEESPLEVTMELPSLKLNYESSMSLAQHLLEFMSNSDAETVDPNASTEELSGKEDGKKNGKDKKKFKKKEDNSDKENQQKKSSSGSKIKYDKLLRAKLSETDSSEAEEKWRKHKMKEAAKNSDENKTKKKRGKYARLLSSDSSDAVVINSTDSSDSSNKITNDKERTPPPKNKRRRRIKAHSSGSTGSSDEEGDSKITDSTGKGRKNIRKVLKEEHLKESTQTALKEEQERKKRIIEKQKLYNTFINTIEEDTTVVKELEEVVLDFDPKTKETLLALDKSLVKKLKPHQADGIKFMWDACFESLADTKKKKGSGCILAHCMGLGKSLQVVSLLHTLMGNSEQTGIRTALVVCPVSTVLNWVNEFEKWLKDVGSGQDIEVYHMAKTQTSYRVFQLKDWQQSGGVMILGYNLYRILSNEKIKLKAKAKMVYQETLVDPGPDIVICDEGHLLKNESTAISLAMNKIKTRRRIVLTGTPLQNNLIEYHCMVQFVKPNLLGTKKEFKNRFEHPIQNGQFEDSTAHDVKVMKRRAHVLHTMLDGIVQRKDYNVLTPYLPPKYEYVIHLKMSELQCVLYRHYLDNEALRKLFVDFQSLMRVCIHPRALLMKCEKDFLKEDEEESEGSLKNFIDDGSDSESSTSSSSLATSNSDDEKSESSQKAAPKRRTRANASEIVEDNIPLRKSDWWTNLVSEDQLEDVRTGSKIFLFFVILKFCEEIGDKLLVFSQSLYTLDVMEFFLNKIDEESRKSEPDPRLAEFTGCWAKGADYFRLDGGSSFDNRNACCKAFNNENNTRARLFLISTRAGGLGINLTGANRVIIFDASWNPSYDVQSLFRVYRFGQSKPCYIYRFLSKGTMEEKIYERQVAKLSTSLRVIDEHQIDRHFSQSSLAELYTFNPEGSELQATPVLPKDRLMAELIQSHGDIILSYHQHDSLLENQEDQELTEEERKAAWVEFENEKKPQPNFPQTALFFNDVQQRLKIQCPNLTDDECKTRAMEIFQNYQMIQRQHQQLDYQRKVQQHYQQQQQQQQQQQRLNQPTPVIQHTQAPNQPSASTTLFNNAYQPYRFPESILKTLQQPSQPAFGINPKAAAAAAATGVSSTAVRVNSTTPADKQSSANPGISKVNKPEVLQVD